ncbi:hypothetical protein [Chengkuizengella axinellae]|uniref:Uncharacterized protein n=1 Tax=Chengkuizengella axinellae TaxID=3064388 RepID=A0ABT9J442_9BACL|nr:hypothetical protein [Chengkuizengella sp. 2205SS18-9]MDP5276238.1 hypothetical protein [Chengkuizengella sp. 2205SS18-9]
MSHKKKNRKTCCKKIQTCDCCIISLKKQIEENFDEFDPIGLTFVGTDVLLVAVGTFIAVRDEVLVARNIFNIPGTESTSYIPLCDLLSVDKLDNVPAEGNVFTIQPN